VVKLFNQPPPHLDAAAPAPGNASAGRGDSSICQWRDELPRLTGAAVTLRELEVADAPALCGALSSELVTRYLNPPPSTVEGFAAFIERARRQRHAGQYACFAIVPHGSDMAVGLYQIRALEPAFGTAEWGFAMSPDFWGTGIFADGAGLLINFAFDVMGVRRLEARAAMKNGRANGALKKVGAVMEGVLRHAFSREGEYLDQALWTILRDEWTVARRQPAARVVFH
jgi:ribosomal-protein-alanine N-acetyltransferase